MKKAMKFLGLASMVVMALGWAREAGATAASANISLKVTPSCSRGITVVAPAGGLIYDFQSVAFGATTVSTQAVVVTNTSSCGDDWILQVTANSGGTTSWASNDGTALTGTIDKYNLYAAFATAQPTYGTMATAGNNVKQASQTTCTGTSNFFVTGGQNCSAVPSGSSENLWFGLQMPLGQTDGTATQRTIVATITTQP